MKIKNILYILVIILLNIASTTLFFRLDLTENRSYSLSKASIDLVKNLEEPLTIKVFLSDNLPVPYNTLERDIRDILLEYSLKANKHFNYTIDLISKEKEPRVKPETYGIYPVKIQNIQEDEVKVVSAYIGLTILHSDLVETIPAIQYNQNLELLLTNKIRILTEKSSSLLSLKNNIKVKLLLSPILYQLSSELQNYSQIVKTIVDDINSDFFNRVEFEFQPVDNSVVGLLTEEYNLKALNIRDQNNNESLALASVVVENGNESQTIDLINQDIFGRTVISNSDDLKLDIKSNINKMIGAKTKIGYLTSNGTIPMSQNQMLSYQGQQNPTINNLLSLIQNDYSLNEVNLEDGYISDDIKTLIIARPVTQFTQRELFILDQFLLKGNSLLLGIDQIEMDMTKSNPNYGVEVYKNVDHGLTELLLHHGIKLNSNMIMDQNSFNQVQRDQNGSIQETKIYFAPLISNKNLNKQLPYLNGLTDLITFRMSEVEGANSEDRSVSSLFYSSENSWVVTPDKLTMAPERITPSDQLSKHSLAVIKEGGFKSYFYDKNIPPAELKESTEDDGINSINGVSENENLIKESANGKIVVLGSSDMLTDSLISQNYSSNILFIQNIIDYLSGREDYTEMRSKGVFIRPMDETTAAQRNIIKYFNIVGLPILVALFGIIVYLKWLSRKNRIKNEFMGVENEK